MARARSASERESRTALDFTVVPEDREFVELLMSTSELEVGDKEFRSYLRFNLGAIDRGRRVVSKIERLRPVAGVSALDIGTGSGGLAISLAEAGARVAAIEPDDRRREWASARVRGHGVDVALLSAVAERLPFPDAAFDIVSMDSVIEHVEDPGVAVSEVCRVLRPQGVVYLVSPSKASLINVLRDPHYGMLGVVLMPRWLGRWYVERVRRHPRGYWVNRIPSRMWLTKRFQSGGVELIPQAPEGLEKLSRPSQIRRHPWVRRAAKLAVVLHLTPWLRRAAISQAPVHVFLGRKR